MKLKSLIAGALAAGMLFPAALSVSAALLGDADQNGVVDVNDIAAVKSAVMSDSYTDEFLLAADADRNGYLDVNDISAIKSIVLSQSEAAPEPEEPDPEEPDTDPEEPNPDPEPDPDPEEPTDGWYEKDGKRYYYADGKYFTGHQTIGSFKYYFDKNGVLSSFAGIDISSYQEKVDWEKVKKAGADFTFLRVGGRYWGSGAIYSDDYFERNAEEAYAAGLEVGAYFYSQAITAEEALEEADFVLSKIKGHKMTYPIVFDCEKTSSDNPEGGRADRISKELRTEIAKTFCDRLEEAGYYAMIYANPDWSENGLIMEELSEYDFWLAHYTDSTSYEYPYSIWQYSESGSVPGVSGGTDMNISYLDYAKIIREAGLNHLEDEEKPDPEEPSPEEPAPEEPDTEKPAPETPDAEIPVSR